MLSIWGSDLTYFADLDGHREKVSSALLKADSISAECIRDYRIAKKLGFIGLELPIIPVSASFNFSDRDDTLVPMIDRNLILVKTYGKPFGRGDLAIDAIENFLTDNADPEVFFYSVGPDLVERVKSLALKFSGRVNFSLARAPILQQDLYSYFRRARLYVGVSESDGISTSFLEAIAFGAYPIQTNTSCANEWEAIGVSCSLINVATSSIMEAMSENYYDLDKLQQSQSINFMIAKSKLDNVQISSIAQNFYFRNSSST
jgi:glycosyltransferase involved in cell wall biosynthesis